jgi:serine/threonine protein kinase
MVTCDLTKAVAYLHNLKPPIIHRDIKPTNVMITTVGNFVKLNDFASEKVYDYEKNICYSQSNFFYCSPEICVKNAIGSAPHDIWAVGATILFMFSGTIPWDTKHFYDTKNEVKHRRIADKMNKNWKPDRLRFLDENIKEIVEQYFNYDNHKRITAIKLLELFENLATSLDIKF